MSGLFALTAGATQWLPLLFGGSVFGFTASLGQLVVEVNEPDSEENQPADGVLIGRRSLVERRQSLRCSSIPVRVEVVDRRTGWVEQGWVVDRSRGGLGLELETAPRLGGVLDVRPCETPGLEVWVLAVVRNCVERMDCWKVGCQFVQPPASGVMHLFG